MNDRQQQRFILHENLWKVMFTLSWPAVVGMVLYGLNVIVDAIIVGRYVGESAFAGISLAFPLTQIPLGIGQLIGGGAGAVLSIAIGSKCLETQKKILGNVNILTITLSLVFMVVGLIFSTLLIKMMGGEGRELEYGDAYFRSCLYGSIFWVAGLAGNLIVRAEGKMKTAAVMMGIGLIVNIVVTYFLIVIGNWGVEGAAFGTNVGMAVYSLTFIIYVLRKKTSFNAVPFSFTTDTSILKSIFSNGFPLFIMSVMMVIQGIVVLNALTNYGTTADVTFYGTVFRIMSFMMMPIIGLMRSFQPVVGINYGAGYHERVVQSLKIWVATATLCIFPFWFVLMAYPEVSLTLIMPDRQFSNTDISNYRYFIAPLIVLPVVFMGMTFFPAINKGRSAAIIGLARQVIFFVPIMLFLPKIFGVAWVYIGSCGIDIVITLWMILLISKEIKRFKETSTDEVLA